ncbi:MAG: hypothetical protein DMD34_01510 [Gemmatimonadetes bacterium]|nr:MAG: hypothetical protein DMD34_01510 [Gemmatimonadota bacterium]
MTMTLALGWALVDSLWQDALAAAGLAALFALIPVRAARIRYALATVTLLLMLAFPLATAVRLTHEPPWTLEYETATAVAPSPAATNGASGPVAGAAAAPVAERIRASLEPMLPWVVLLWFGGVVTLSLRLASGWLVTRRLRSVGTDPVPDACLEAVSRLAQRLEVSRPVRALQSAVVQVPAVVGWLRPVILLPASALTGLTPLQLDALLAHELAHVRRYDYVVNLVQSVIETLLFYHPAVWWVSRSVREEREHCCDDLAVRVCGDAHFYATALLGMERLRVATPAFAMAAAGGSLMARVRRLVAPAQTEFPRWTAGVVAVSLALGGGAHLATGAVAQGNSPAHTAPYAIARVEAIADPEAREHRPPRGRPTQGGRGHGQAQRRRGHRGRYGHRAYAPQRRDPSPGGQDHRGGRSPEGGRRRAGRDREPRQRPCRPAESRRGAWSPAQHADPAVPGPLGPHPPQRGRA